MTVKEFIKKVSSMCDGDIDIVWHDGKFRDYQCDVRILTLLGETPKDFVEVFSTGESYRPRGRYDR